MTTGELNREQVSTKPGSKVIQFLFCLGLAIIFWLFTSLSAVHQDTIDVRLQYILADNKVSTLKLPTIAELEVEARGWELLEELFLTRSLSVDLGDFTDDHLLLTNSNLHLFEKELPESYHILHISPDTLHLFFDDKVTKKVPVSFRLQLPLPGAQVIDSLHLLPDSVELSGARSIIDTIRFWPTEILRISNPDTVLNGVAILQDPAQQNIRLSAIAVSYSAALSFLTRNSFTTKLRVNGSQHRLIHVTYSVPLKVQENYSVRDFTFDVQEDTVTHVKKIICTHFPDSVQNITIEPALITE